MDIAAVGAFRYIGIVTVKVTHNAPHIAKVNSFFFLRSDHFSGKIRGSPATSRHDFRTVIDSRCNGPLSSKVAGNATDIMGAGHLRFLVRCHRDMGAFCPTDDAADVAAIVVVMPFPHGT